MWVRIPLESPVMVCLLFNLFQYIGSALHIHKKSKQRMFLCIFQYDKLEELKGLWVGKPRFRRMEDSKKIFYKFLFLREINF